jgi:hypothetical protein
MKLTYNHVFTFNGQNGDPSIDQVFTDEAGEYIVAKHIDPVQPPFAFRFSVRRTDREPIRSWRVLQDIKNEIAGRERTAIEVYPPESEVSDVANIYHLWVFEEGYGPRLGLRPGKRESA